MAINRLLTDVVLQRLQALRAAFRVGGVRTPTQDDRAEAIRASYGYPIPLHVIGPNTGDVHRLTPGRQDCRICREFAQSVAPAERIGPVAVLRELVREHFGDDALVNGAGFREAERILAEPAFQPGGIVQTFGDEAPEMVEVHTFGDPEPTSRPGGPIEDIRQAVEQIIASQLVAVDTPPERLHGPTHCGGPLHCPVCADWWAVRELAVGRRIRHPLSSGEPATWINMGTTYSMPLTELAAPSYTAARALEELRRMTTAEGTGGGAAAYAPAEGPTSACFQCGRNVPPADLFVGKRSGIALCEPCLEKWEKAGRAKRTGDF